MRMPGHQVGYAIVTILISECAYNGAFNKYCYIGNWRPVGHGSDCTDNGALSIQRKAPCHEKDDENSSAVHYTTNNRKVI